MRAATVIALPPSTISSVSCEPFGYFVRPRPAIHRPSVRSGDGRFVHLHHRAVIGHQTGDFDFDIRGLGVIAALRLLNR
jgi:hypothetical protein